MPNVNCVNGHLIGEGMQVCTVCGMHAVQAAPGAPASAAIPVVGGPPVAQVHPAPVAPQPHPAAVPAQPPAGQWAASYPAPPRPPVAGRVPFIAGLALIALGLFFTSIGPWISVTGWVNDSMNCIGWGCEPSNPMGALWGWVGTGVGVIAIGVIAALFGLNRMLARKGL